VGADDTPRRGALRPGAVAPDPTAGETVVRVLPDAGSLDKQFDYTVPARSGRVATVGSAVRVDLAGRRVAGWVTAVDVEPPPGVELRPVAHIRGWGPTADVVELTAWGAWRWAGRRAALLATASGPNAVPFLGPPALRAPVSPPSSPLDGASLVAGAVTVVTAGPAVDLTPAVAALAQRGPTLVVVPSVGRAAVLAGRLRQAGADVALLPGEWARARAGAAVVVGARAAAWAPCPGLAAVLVVDGHDEALTQEQAPTWTATEVVAERARRAGVPCVVTSPCPTVALIDLARRSGGSLHVAAGPPGWAPLDVVDLREEDPRVGLWSPRVVALARGAGRVVVVLNRTGRARLLTCGSCRSVARCERCGAAVGAAAAGAVAAGAAAGPGGEAGDAGGREVLGCPRCGLERPVVCAVCGSTALRRLRLGVTRAREQLEALALRPVGEVTAASTAVPDTPVLVGTEAVLHRVERADVVAFVDLDSQLLAPRYRAAEETIALLARAARLVGGGRRTGARVVVQTRLPDHPVLRAAATGNLEALAAAEGDVRAALRLPPAAAVAVLSGPGAEAYAAALAGDGALEVLATGAGRWVVRAATTAELCDGLAAVARPAGERLRVEVDPLVL
jgi:primosomal protein N' (replication factor Y)